MGNKRINGCFVRSLNFFSPDFGLVYWRIKWRLYLLNCVKPLSPNVWVLIFHIIIYFEIYYFQEWYIILYCNWEGPSWYWSYGSWIYNFMCNQCLSPLKLWVRIPLMANVYSIQYCVINFVSDLWQIGSFPRVLRFPPPIKLTYRWKWR